MSSRNTILAEPSGNDGRPSRIDFSDLSAAPAPDTETSSRGGIHSRVSDAGSSIISSVKRNPAAWAATGLGVASIAGLSIPLGLEISQNEKCQATNRNQTSELDKARDKVSGLAESIQSVQEAYSSLLDASNSTTADPTTVTVTQTVSGKCGTTTDGLTFGGRSAYPGSAVTPSSVTASVVL